MKVLIAYATTEGQTRKIAEALADRIRERGDEVTIFNTEKPLRDLHPEVFDKLIVAGSVHQKRHQDSLEIFVEALHKKLQSISSMFVSVSLASAFDDGADESNEYIGKFLERTRWEPDVCLPVAGALRYKEYDYFKAQIIEHIVLEGRTVDGPDEHEFTDWEPLFSALDDFLGAQTGN